MKTGIELIAEEYKKLEGNINEMLNSGEVGHKDELAVMAATFCLPDKVYDFSRDMVTIKIKRDFLWPTQLSRPRPRKRINELIKAGALIAAEIDRLQSSPAPKGQ